MLVARRPEAAARLLIEALGSVTGCVTTERLVAPTSYFVSDIPYEIALPYPPASLRASSGGPSGLHLGVRFRFVIVEAPPERQCLRWSVMTTMYEYRLLDHEERELLVYHWQPGPSFLGPDHPHLHVSAALSAQTSALERRSIDLDKLHLAAGRVSLASVVRMLITEFGIAPRRHDWAEVLDRAERVFQEEMGPPA